MPIPSQCYAPKKQTQEKNTHETCVREKRSPLLASKKQTTKKELAKRCPPKNSYTKNMHLTQ